LLATHGGAFGQSPFSNLSFLYCEGSPCVKLRPANESFAVCTRNHSIHAAAVEGTPLPRRMRHGLQVTCIFIVAIYLYADSSLADDRIMSIHIISSTYFHVKSD
jgi:hypothetical protein